MPSPTIEIPSIEIKEYQNRRVLTLKDINRLHGKSGNAAQKAFRNNREHFTEGRDYFIVPMKEYNSLYLKSCEKQSAGNPNIPIALITDTGYILIAKSFRDESAWGVQKTLIDRYFEMKPLTQSTDQQPASALSATSQFDLMRQVIDHLEASYHREMDLARSVARLEQEVKQLVTHRQQIQEAPIQTEQLLLPGFEEEADPDPVVTTELYKAATIAARMNLFAGSRGLPHSKLIVSIARTLGYKIYKRESYEDDRIVVMKDLSGAEEIWQVYYKPQAFKEIKWWFDENKENLYYEKRYQRNHGANKKGDLMQAGYTINGVNWAIAV